MKILLVGGLGFIGRRFIRKFFETHELVVYATKEDIQNAKKSIALKNIPIEEGRVEDKNLFSVIEKYKPDAVIHLAALTGLEKCHKNPELAFEINVFGTFNVIKSCIKSSTKLIFISSREVYGETKGYKSKEDDPLLPNNVYGITKMLGENLVKMVNQSDGLDYTILRLTNVYGPEGDQYGAQIIIKNAINEKKIKILGGSQRLNYVYVDDVVDVMNLALDNKQASNQTFNVGSKESITVEEFSSKVAELVEHKIEREYLPMRQTETTNFEPDIEKMKGLLSYEPKTPLETGIKNTIKWYSDETNF